MVKNWHNLDWKEVVGILDSDSKKGLSEKEVQVLQEKFGRNKLPEKKPLSSIKIFLEQFKSPLIYILIVAGGVSFGFGELKDGFVILGAVLLNTTVGFWQERKASNILYELSKVLKSKAIVIREGRKKEVFQEELVPGDIFVLAPGGKVPADGRLIKSSNLKINEAPLTGEWIPQIKKIDVLPKDTSLADRTNMAYMGTTVETGRGVAVATETGLKTQIGKIARMVKGIEEERTPYQKKLARFSRIVGIFLSLICLLIFVEGIVKGRDFLKMFKIATAVAVAAIPEGLPVAMTTILALGMKRILKKEGMIRKLASVETLGSTSIIATDKTLTLTQGKMEIEKIIAKDKRKALEIGALSAEAFVENPERPVEDWEIRGSSTDKGLVRGAAKKRLKKPDLEKEFPLLDRVPFNVRRKFSAALFSGEKYNLLYLSGAPEKILALSKLSPKGKEKIKQGLERLTQKGLRVIGVAQKKVPKGKKKILISGLPKGRDFFVLIKDLEFKGLIGLKDPLRKDVIESISRCQRAKIRPILVTGDHLLTAKAVAKKLGFEIGDENTILGKELDGLSDEEFEQKIERLEIYARVEPRHKLRIIKAWQKKGKVIAMTGDGVNDAPALKKADVGVALGSGTEVAKKASDLVLLSDSFSVIVRAVEEGRAILDNIRKVIAYLISDSFTEVLLVGASILAKVPLPVTALQILWVNLIEDGLPGIALSFEPREKDVMERGPESPQVPLLNKEMKALTLIAGLIDDLTLLTLFFWLFQGFGILEGLRSTLLQGREFLSFIRTMIFANLGIDTFYVALCCKSLRKNIWEVDFFSNKFLIVAELFGILMLWGAIYFSPIRSILETVPLRRLDWLIVVLVGIFDLALIETTKWYFKTHDTN